ncbi:GAF and ANTAR domain-containing protein [Rhodococcus qingshengii]|uniref:GAF and ANTAR domain-containing protein n=1 Tax=Rhodococcus qingshengii TaxID=334542 RepID=UPI001BE98385|nr:GAF and ANTAR domain-containing protein [Rhodococcus qingshengii]MBT2270183.1 GAF and ANTAR domain-containing protein [Rhodococcus qingshengii]
MSENLATSEFDPSEPFPVTIELVRQLVAETRVDGAAVAVFATETTRNLVFASDEGAEELDDLQFILGEGPGLDAYRFHRQELHDDLAGGQAHVRWPFFASQALAAGAASFYAYPLAGGGTPFGVLELYGRSPIALSPSDDVTCRALTRPIARAMLSELDQLRGAKSADHLVSVRANVDIACGMLAAHHKISVDEALVRLRALAFSRQCRITELAQSILGGECFESDLR